MISQVSLLSQSVSIQNFIIIGLFFNEIWRYSDVHSPFSILKIEILKLVSIDRDYCHGFCVKVQNIAKTGQYVVELWPKLRRYTTWRGLRSSAVLDVQRLSFGRRIFIIVLICFGGQKFT